MKPIAPPLLILTLLPLALCLPGDAESAQPTRGSKFESEKSLQGVPVTPEIRRQRAAESAAWHRNRLRAAYERAGSKDSTWNDALRSLLDEVAERRSGAGLADSGKIEGLLRQIHQLGCTDPLFRYYTLRYSDAPTKAEEAIPAIREAAQSLRDSGYDALEKFWATVRAAKQIQDGSDSKIPQEVVHLRRAAVDLLASALGDPNVPAGEVVSASEALLQVLKYNPIEYRAGWDRLVPLWTNSWSRSPELLLVVGRGHLDRAWMARGGGYADSVSQSGWKEFAAELARGEWYLTNSWSLGALSGTARQMMRLELGQGESRERMELWFGRAMELNPGDYEACAEKLWYLMPRWYGDHQEVLEFGRSCVSHPRWNGEVPLALMRARELISYDLPKEERPTYWRRKEVWADVRRSFERFFELNPKNVSWRHNYAWFAWQSQDWDELNRQIPLLGKINHTYFGGKDQFDRMIAEAAARQGDGPR